MGSLHTSVKVSAGGRIVIPAEYRRALGVRTGDELRLALINGEVRLSTKEQALRRVQARVRKLVPRGVSLVDELIRERREEAARE